MTMESGVNYEYLKALWPRMVASEHEITLEGLHETGTEDFYLRATTSFHGSKTWKYPSDGDAGLVRHSLHEWIHKLYAQAVTRGRVDGQ